MSITVTCPDCDKKLKVKDEAAGKKTRCPGCSAVFQVPEKSEDADDDFFAQDEVVAPKRKRRAAEDLDDEDPPAFDEGRRKPRKVTNKKSGRKKSGGTNWLLIGGVAAGGLFLAVFAAALLLPAVAQARKAAAIRAAQLANWTTFPHPMGFVQIDMPGTPTFNAKQSVNGSQTFSLAQPNYQMSLTALMPPPAAQTALNGNPAVVEIMFNEMETKTPQQMPGATLLSSRRMTTGAYRGMEMRVDVKGQINTMRFYILQGALVGAEFITRNETANATDRERFFNSIRGPDGNLINASAQPTNASAMNSSAAPAQTTAPGSQARSLSEARRAIQTKLIRQERSGQPLPDPPAALARTVRYDAPSGQLAAYVTTIPQDGTKRPAIVWVSGGDCNTIDDAFFKDGPPANDQTASAFRKAGIVTMYVSLRGGNDNPGFKEGFLGEVDDVLAAADFLAKQQGINPDRIYLGGHSTGGTIALLAAESTNHFRAIFSFGPVDDIRGYGAEFMPFDSQNPAEIDARTPAKWIDSIQNRTFVLEGLRKPGNAASIQGMARASHNPQISFLIARRANHFNILAPVTKLIADKILQDEGPTTNITLADNELNLRYAQ